MTSRIAICVLALSCWLAACDSREIADIPYAKVREAWTGGDRQAFDTFFQTIRGKRIDWQGQVVEARPEVGDDFVRTGRLLVDMDAGSEQPPVADVTFEIPPSRIESLSPGQAVGFIAVIRQYGFERDAILLQLELKKLK